MPRFFTQCNHDNLQRLLEDTLSEAQEERLAAHLSDCEKCRQVLEDSAADRDEWLQIGGVLKSEISEKHPSADGACSLLIPRRQSHSGHRSTAGMGVRPEDFAVDFLSPCHNPNALGQLNDIEIRAVIGHGGNGVVLKGFQEGLNRFVAVKVMAPHLAASAAARKRFAREAQATAAIVHPNVMPVLTVHSDGQLPFLVMPCVDCESLQDRLDRDGQLPALDTLRIAHQVANGLAAAHAQGLVHRDVKPANILLEKNVDRVMLTDFGLARATDDATLTRTGIIAGTPQYMSPEQARGDAVDTRSDLFSLGSVMYAMCTGRPPFPAETSYGILRRVTDSTPRSICEQNAGTPAWLAGLIDRLMAKSAQERFSAASDLAALLEDCIAHLQQPSSNALPAEVRRLSGRTTTLIGIGQRALALTRSPVPMLATLLLALLLLMLTKTGHAPDQPGDNDRQSPLPATAPATATATQLSEQPGHPVLLPEPPAEQRESVPRWESELDRDLNELSNDMDALLKSLQ